MGFKSGDDMAKERRRYPRKEISYSANVMTVESQYVLGECFLTNVSENGFALETDCLLDIGDKIFIQINLLNDKVFLVGEVIRVDKGFFEPLYGIRICEDECVNLNFFRTYIKYQLN